MFRPIMACAVAGILCACGATTDDPTEAATSPSIPSIVEATVSLSPTASPTPTPSPSPTPSVDELGQAYIVAADAFNASVCAGNAELEAAAAGTEAEYLAAAVDAFGDVAEAAAELGDALNEMGLESQFGPELAEMQAAVEQRHEAHEAVAGATSLDEAIELVDSLAVPASDRMRAASQALRSALGLAEAPDDVCVREVDE